MATYHYGDEGNDVREVLLTFDDGPNPDTTPQVLDALGEHGIRAIFFVQGSHIERPGGREVMERAYEEGHVIGNHTYSHPNLKHCSEEQIREELARTQELIGECASEPLLCRPPYGARNHKTDRVIHDEGYIALHWNVDTRDWDKKSDAWVEYGIEQVEQREDSLIIMHDVHESTASRVGEFIERIKALDGGIRFVEYA